METRWSTPEPMHPLRGPGLAPCQVVANAVAGLAEISQTCGKDLLDLDKASCWGWARLLLLIPFKQGNIHKLLAALNECNEWGQVPSLRSCACLKTTDLGRCSSWTLSRPTVQSSLPCGMRVDSEENPRCYQEPSGPNDSESITERVTARQTPSRGAAHCASFFVGGRRCFLICQALPRKSCCGHCSHQGLLSQT